MTTHLPISIIDPNHRHRAWLTFALAKEGRHVEPYESVAELSRNLCLVGVYLTYDHDDLVKKVVSAVDPEQNPVAVIAYSDEPHPRNMFRAIKAGAVDYLGGVKCLNEMQSDWESWLEAIQLAEGSIADKPPQKNEKLEARERVRCLTSREQEVLKFLALGSTSREIGDRLGISRRTVEVHRANMQVKLGALNGPHAVRIGIDAGLVT